MEQRIFNLARRRREGGCAVIAIFTRAAVVVAGIVISRVPTAAAMAAATSIKMGLRINEWVILGLKDRQTGGLRRTFALRLGSEFAMNVGWHEH